MDPNEVFTWSRIIKACIIGFVLLMMPLASCTYEKNYENHYKDRLNSTIIELKSKQ